MSAVRRLSVLSAHLTRTPQVTTSASVRPLSPTPIITSPFAKLGSYLSTTTSPVDMSSVKELVDKAIKENDVLVFSKSYCPYCRRAKAILNAVTDEVKVYELDEIDNGSDIQAYLKSLNGQGTVPHVYIKQEFIGGCSDLQRIAQPELVKKIKA